MDEPSVSLAPRPTDSSALKEAILAKLVYSVGKDIQTATDHDWFFATALAVRDTMVDRWMDNTREIYRSDRKRVYYLSLEFLIGRLLDDAIINLGLEEHARQARLQVSQLLHHTSPITARRDRSRGAA